MATNIVLKRSATADAIPSTGDLELGELALNTYDGKIYMKKTVSGSSSIVNLSGGTAASSSAFSHSSYKYTASGSTTTFSGSDDDSQTLSYTAGQLQVFLNGILLDASDYTASNGTSVVLSSAASSGDILYVVSFTGTNPFDYFKYVATNAQTTFTGNDANSESLIYTVGNIVVYLNGVLLDATDYTATSGTTVVLASGATTGDILTIWEFNEAAPGDLASDTSPQLGGDLDVVTYDIVSTSNRDIDIVPNGTGNVTLQTDTVQLGSSAENVTVTTNSTGDLTLNTNSGSNSGSIVIADGANANITVTPNGTGIVSLAGDVTIADGSNDFDIASHDGTNGLKLGGTVVTTSAAELNVVDGSTAASSTTLADADRLILNDNGTMKQVALTDFETYFELSLDTIANLEVTTELQTPLIAFTDGDDAIQIADGGGVTMAAGLTSTAAANTLGATSFGDADITNVGDIQLDSITGDGDTNTSITFTGSDVITVATQGENQVTFTNGAIVPSSDNNIDLGTSLVEFKDAFFDGTVTSDAFAGPLTGDVTGNVSGTAATVTGGTQASITSTANLVTVGTIGTGVWQGTAVASGYIAADAITGAKIADDAIDSEHYTDGSIDNAHIADDAIDSEHYADGSIDTAHIADDQVTLAKMAGLARGKIIYGDSSGNPTALALGTSGQALTSDGNDVTWGSGGKTTEEIQDLVGAMVSGNTESGITVAYEDGDGTIDFTVGTLNQDTTGTAALATSITASANNSTDETVYPTFVDGATGTQGIETDTGLTYNPSSGILTGTQFTGAVVGAVTGNVTGNTSGTAATVTTAAQSNITSLGTLTTLTVDNVIVNGTTIGHTGDTDLMTLTSGNLTVAGDVYIGDSNKELRFYEGSNYVGFEAPALSANQIWVLPSADGSANQTLKTDGSGTLSWATAASAVSNLTDVTLSSVSNQDLLMYNGSAWVNTATASNPSVDTMTGDGSDTTLTLTKTPLHENATSVYIDGVYQSKGNYSVSGTTLTFSTAPPSGTAVECMTGNNGTVATLFNVVNKAGSNIACAILNAAITVVGKSGNITVGVT